MLITVKAPSVSENLGVTENPGVTSDPRQLVTPGSLGRLCGLGKPEWEVVRWMGCFSDWPGFAR